MFHKLKCQVWSLIGCQYGILLQENKTWHKVLKHFIKTSNIMKQQSCNMMTQNSKQSQNNKTKIKSQSVTFTIAVMKKKGKETN